MATQGRESPVATTPRHSVSVAGVVVNEAGEVLVIKRDDNGHWQAPGGVLELYESFEDGVRREVLEETGLAVTVDYLTGVYKNMAEGIVALVFRCRPESGHAVPSREAKEVRWMTIDEAISSMVPAFAVRVKDAFDHSVHLRTHDGHNVLSQEGN